MSVKEVTQKMYCCEVCNYESKNSTEFNECLVCGKKYCIFRCKSNLYFVYNQNVCRICKDNPMVDEITDKWLEKWRSDLPKVREDYKKISKKALKLDRRFTKNWEKNLKIYEDKKRNDKN